jgi:hypothetical protein
MPPPEACADEVLWPIEGLESELREVFPEAKPTEREEPIGAVRTSANPFFATSWLRWPRLAIEPRGIPRPADPAFTIT